MGSATTASRRRRSGSSAVMCASSVAQPQRQAPPTSAATRFVRHVALVVCARAAKHVCRTKENLEKDVTVAGKPPSTTGLMRRHATSAALRVSPTTSSLAKLVGALRRYRWHGKSRLHLKSSRLFPQSASHASLGAARVARVGAKRTKTAIVRIVGPAPRVRRHATSVARSALPTMAWDVRLAGNCRMTWLW